MQATIRAVDVKVAALVVCLLAPLQNLHRVFKHLAHFTEWSIRWPAILVVILFLLTWVAAFVSLVRAIAAAGNPAAYIKGAQGANSAFFLPAQFKFSRIHAIATPKNLLSIDALADVHNNLPQDADVEAALVFEQMKLAYIRDLKLFRLDWGLKLSLLWLLLGILIYIASKFAITEPPQKETAKVAATIQACKISTCYVPPACSNIANHFGCFP